MVNLGVGLEMKVLTFMGVVFEFFHLVNAFYESISEHCTARTCGPLTIQKFGMTARDVYVCFHAW